MTELVCAWFCEHACVTQTCIRHIRALYALVVLHFFFFYFGSRTAISFFAPPPPPRAGPFLTVSEAAKHLHYHYSYLVTRPKSFILSATTPTQADCLLIVSMQAVQGNDIVQSRVSREGYGHSWRRASLCWIGCFMSKTGSSGLFYCTFFSFEKPPR